MSRLSLLVALEELLPIAVNQLPLGRDATRDVAISIGVATLNCHAHDSRLVAGPARLVPCCLTTMLNPSLLWEFDWNPLLPGELSSVRSETLVMLGNADRLIRGAKPVAKKGFPVDRRVDGGSRAISASRNARSSSTTQ